MIEMTVVCRSCGVEWEPTRQDFTRGDWRECPRCRHGPDMTPDPQTDESTHRREDMTMTNLTDALRKAYLANGGTEEGFNARKDRLISEAREQAAIKAAIDEANRPPDMNQLLREMVDRKLDGRRMRGTLDVRTLDNKKEARNG